MGPSTDITRAKIERETAAINLRCAVVELASKFCGVLTASLMLAGAVVVSGTAILLKLM